MIEVVGVVRRGLFYVNKGIE